MLERVLPGSAGDVEEALARGVLVADGPALGFRHELLRAAIEASISPIRHTQLSARARFASNSMGSATSTMDTYWSTWPSCRTPSTGFPALYG